MGYGLMIDWSLVIRSFLKLKVTLKLLIREVMHVKLCVKRWEFCSNCLFVLVNIHGSK